MEEEKEEGRGSPLHLPTFEPLSSPGLSRWGILRVSDVRMSPPSPLIPFLLGESMFHPLFLRPFSLSLSVFFFFFERETRERERERVKCIGTNEAEPRATRPSRFTTFVRETVETVDINWWILSSFFLSFFPFFFSKLVSWILDDFSNEGGILLIESKFLLILL